MLCLIYFYYKTVVFENNYGLPVQPSVKQYGHQHLVGRGRLPCARGVLCVKVGCGMHTSAKQSYPGITYERWCNWKNHMQQNRKEKLSSNIIINIKTKLSQKKTVIMCLA